MDLAGPFPAGTWPGAEPGDEVRRATIFLLVAYQLLTPEEVATRKANMEDARAAAGAEEAEALHRARVDLEFQGEGLRVLYYTMPLEGKSAAHVIPAMQTVVNEICKLFGAPVVYRIHGDRAGELTGPPARAYFEERGIKATSTPGYEPDNNGRAERGVGIIKGRARTMLMALARADSTLWPLAIMHAS